MKSAIYTRIKVVIMEKYDLYKLPKDVLIHLISTIQSDLKSQLEQNEEMTQNILNTLRNKSKTTSIEVCSEKGCGSLFFFEEDMVNYNHIDYFNNEELSFCECSDNNCKYNCPRNADKGIGWYCIKHLPPNCEMIGPTAFICEKCTNNCNSSEFF